MKNLFISLFGLFLATTCGTASAQTFRTEALLESVQTLRVAPAERWDAPPIIHLNSNEIIDISFDILSATPDYCTYRILHCDADWKPSQLLLSEYMEGLQNRRVEDYADSFNTTMDYVNYRLSIPNDEIRLKVSGNYVVQIFRDNDSEPLLNACFSVVEPQTGIRMEVSPATDRGVNTAYQAVRFEIDYGNEIHSPARDLKVFVLQNNRPDNQAKLLKPLSLQGKRAVYDHSPALIFEAGNEYRSFEMTTTQYAGLHVETVQFFAPYYHTTLRANAPRNNRFYLFNEDINGRIFVRNNNAQDPDIEADYQFVHFYLACDKPLTEPVYILSEAFNNLLDERSQMEYSAAEGGYFKTALLKEGYYNYLYVSRKGDSATTAPIEGNYYQTENEYRLMIYARPVGGRYDKLIGVQAIQFK